MSFFWKLSKTIDIKGKVRPLEIHNQGGGHPAK